jgi:hypothetical protein
MKRVELKSINDLVYLAASSPFDATIQHFKDEQNKDFYYLIRGTMVETILYFFEGKEITGKFINLVMTKNEVSYADLPIIDPKIKVIPIIEVKTQDLF